MNLSRRKLLLGAAAVAVAPALPVEDLLPPVWVPNPSSRIVIEPKGEVFYGGAAGGGKMWVGLSGRRYAHLMRAINGS